MNNILTVMKKELFRFFHDRRMILSCLIMPGLLIYIMYSFMGQAFGSMDKVDEEYMTKVYAENVPQSLKTAFDSLNIDYLDTNGVSQDQMKESVENKETDLVMIFPKDFEQQVAAYDSMTATTKAPQIEIYYNSSKNESSKAYSTVNAILSQYESSMTNKFDVNASADEKFDLASDKDSVAHLFSMLFPMLLLTFSFSACISIAPESIAGEKERGTLTTILCTPIKRSQLVMGKIASLSLIAVLGGCSSFIGTILSLPKLLQADENNLNTNVYQATDYVLLFLLVFCSVLLIISLISIISAFAKSVKEAGTFISPLMIIVIVVGLSGMFGSGASKDLYAYFIPLYNSVQCMTSVFTFDVNIMHIIITVLSNIAYAGIGVFILTRMFNSEKIMLTK